MQNEQNSLVLVVADKNYSSWSMRPWLALKATGLAFEERNIVLDRSDTAEQIRKYSPSGRVPCLVHGTTIVWDSLAICEYLAETPAGRKLWPESREQRAHARCIVAEMHSGFAALRQQLSMDIRLRMRMGHLLLDTVTDIRRIMAIWKECLAKSEGPFLFGSFTIADAYYAPVVMRFRSYGIETSDRKITDYMHAVCGHEHVQEWVTGAEKEANAQFTF